MALEKSAQGRQTLNKALPNHLGLSIFEIAVACVVLLSQGKTGIDAIEYPRQDGLVVEVLGISAVPDASTLRMQLDAQANKLLPLTDNLSVAMLKQLGVLLTPRRVAWCCWTLTCSAWTTCNTRRDGV